MAKKNLNTLTAEIENSGKILTANERRNIEIFQELIKEEAGAEALDYFKDLGVFQTDRIIVLSSKRSFSYEEEYVSGIRIIFNLKKMNLLPQLNFLFYKINNLLPIEGYYIGCYEDIKTIRKYFISDSYKIIGRIWFYLFYYFPLLLNRIPILNSLIASLGKGKRKQLSFYDVRKIMVKNGFKVVANKSFGEKIYFIAKKNIEVKQVRKIFFWLNERILRRNAIINV